MSDLTNLTVLHRISHPTVGITDVELCGQFVFVTADNMTDPSKGIMFVYTRFNTTTNTMELYDSILGKISLKQIILYTESTENTRTLPCGKSYIWTMLV